LFLNDEKTLKRDFEARILERIFFGGIFSDFCFKGLRENIFEFFFPFKKIFFLDIFFSHEKVEKSLSQKISEKNEKIRKS